MEKICLVFGGDSVENEISILTALKVQKELEKYSFPYLLVYLDHDGNFYTGKALLHKNNYQNLIKFKRGSFIKKNNEYYFQSGLKKEKFDVVLLLSHGYKCEDGTLGGYFETLKIPCIYPGLIQSALLQDKVAFKRIMDSLAVYQVKYEVVNEKLFSYLIENKKEITNLKYPLIVKPSHLGSSIGVCKAINEEELIDALIDGFRYDDILIIEEAVENLKEVNVAIFSYKEDLKVSLLETVNNEEKVLSFIDKYDCYSLNESHIIPADIDSKLAKKIVHIAKKVYQKLNLKSVVRFDFLINEETKNIYLNEVNAIPGSLAYYLFEKQDIKMVDLIDMLIREYYFIQEKGNRRINIYHQGFLSSLKEK